MPQTQSLIEHLLYAVNPKTGKPLRHEQRRFLLTLLSLCDGDPEEHFPCSLSRIAEAMSPTKREVTMPMAGNRITKDGGQPVIFTASRPELKFLGRVARQLSELGFLDRYQLAEEGRKGNPYWWAFRRTNAAAVGPRLDADSERHIVAMAGQYLLPAALVAFARLRVHARPVGNGVWATAPMKWDELGELAAVHRDTLKAAVRENTPDQLGRCCGLRGWHTVPNPTSRAELVVIEFAEPDDYAPMTQQPAVTDRDLEGWVEAANGVPAAVAVHAGEPASDGELDEIDKPF